MTKTRPIADYFWLKVDKTPGHGPKGECWVWTASTNGRGYGKLGSRRQRRMIAAHRLSWELHSGPIPEGLHVLHHCDNPPCVNPSHLFLGTRSDNMRDMVSKGRNGAEAPRGERHPLAKLNTEKVLSIRARWRQCGLKKLGAEFGVVPHTIWNIVKRRTWSHV